MNGKDALLWGGLMSGRGPGGPLIPIGGIGPRWN